MPSGDTSSVLRARDRGWDEGGRRATRHAGDGRPSAASDARAERTRFPSSTVRSGPAERRSGCRAQDGEGSEDGLVREPPSGEMKVPFDLHETPDRAVVAGIVGGHGPAGFPRSCGRPRASVAAAGTGGRRQPARPRWIRRIDRIVAGHPMSVVVGDGGRSGTATDASGARAPASTRSCCCRWRCSTASAGGTPSRCVRSATGDRRRRHRRGNLYLRGARATPRSPTCGSTRCARRDRQACATIAGHVVGRHRSVPSRLVRARLEELLPQATTSRCRPR